MRIHVIILAVLAFRCDAWPQEIDFRNRIAGLIDAPVFDTDCTTRLAGDTYLGQAYIGLTPDSLAASGIALPFGAGAQAGYWGPFGQGLVVRAPTSGPVFAQLRAWEAAAGLTYEAAVSAGGKHGFSNIVPTIAPGPLGEPADLIGLESFCLIPEPPSWLLAAVGGFMVWLARFSRLGRQVVVRVDGSESRHARK